MVNREKEEKFLSKISTPVWRILSNMAFVLPALLAFALQRVFSIFPAFVEYIYTGKIFRFLSTPVGYLTSRIPFSLTELLLYLSVPGTVVLMVLFIRQLKRSKNRRQTLLADGKRVGWILSVLYLVFMLFHGFNYARLPLNMTLQIDTTLRSSQELRTVCDILLEKTNTARLSCTEEDGVMVLRNGIGDALKNARLGYVEVKKVYPALSGFAWRAKGVLASRYWSYTGISGMYFPFFVEANVNIDIPQMLLPNTILHELAHTIGIAREDEANFAAFLTGIHHPNTDFQYSSYLSAFIQASNALYCVDSNAYGELFGNVSDAVLRDLQANSAYWRQFEGPVQEISTSVNNAYLQSNMQEDGVKSYGRVVDLIMGYYLS